MKNQTIWRRKPPHFCAIRSSGISIRKRKNSVSQPYSMPPFDSITMWNKIRSLREDAARLPPKARASNQPSQQKAKRNGKGSWIKKSDDDPTNQPTNISINTLRTLYLAAILALPSATVAGAEAACAEDRRDIRDDERGHHHQHHLCLQQPLSVLASLLGVCVCVLVLS